MQTFDFTPFYKNSIGVERLFNTLQSHADANLGNYPPYNIISTGDDTYTIEIAVTGFNEEDLNITSINSQLIVKGDSKSKDKLKVNYLHQGISNRKFKRVFNLADYVEVRSADLINGVLVIKLERHVPDSLKPKSIEIGAEFDSTRS